MISRRSVPSETTLGDFKIMGDHDLQRGAKLRPLKSLIFFYSC